MRYQIPDGIDITHRFIELISQDKDILNRTSPPNIGTDHSFYFPDRKQLHYGDIFYTFGYDYLPDYRNYYSDAHYVLQKKKYLGAPNRWAPEGSFSYKTIWECTLSGHINATGDVRGGFTKGFHPFLSIAIKKAVFVAEYRYGGYDYYIYVHIAVDGDDLVFRCRVEGGWRSYLDITI